MQYRYPDYYGQFRCIGGQCPQTCCTGWKITIDDRTLCKYKKASRCAYFPEIFRKKLSEQIDIKEKLFLSGGGQCPFLDREGLCEIYKELGPDGLCTTCRKYPRHMEDYGQLREVMLSMSCPEAARLILSRKEKDIFRIRLTGKKVRQPVDSRKLKRLLSYRSRLIKIMQQRDVPIELRLGKILELSKHMQQHFEMEEEGCEQSKGGALKHIALTETGRATLCRQYVEMTEALEQIAGDWDKEAAGVSEVLKKAACREDFAAVRTLFKKVCGDFEAAWEHLIVYSLFSNFLAAVYDGDIQTKVKLTAYMYLVVREMLFARSISNKGLSLKDIVEISSSFARLTEHSDTNIEALEAMLSGSPLFSTKIMAELING